MMSERTVKYPAISPELCPCHRHIHRFVGCMAAVHHREAGGRKHFHRRVHMQVILFTAHGKIRKPLHNRAGALYDINGVIHPVPARVADPLSSSHKLPFHILAERIAHPPVAPCYTAPCRHGIPDIITVFCLDLPMVKHGTIKSICISLSLSESISCPSHTSQWYPCFSSIF